MGTPANVSAWQIPGAGILGGVGFTMSPFIAGLAFGGTPALDTAKTGILAGSLIAGTLGGARLWIAGSEDARVTGSRQFAPRR